jgi:transposase
MKKKYIVRLSAEEREELSSLVKKGRVAARKRCHAEILLKADQGEQGPSRNDKEISEALDISRSTVERVRYRLVEEGMESALNDRKKSRYRTKKLDGENEARLIALCCSDPPKGQSRWTLKLLACRMVELEYVDSISTEAIRKVLKKNELKPWQKKQWCIPPEENAEFVCAMEDVLEIYCQEYNENNPVICMDEASKQLVKEVRIPILAQPGEPEKYDAEYERLRVKQYFYVFRTTDWAVFCQC